MDEIKYDSQAPGVRLHPELGTVLKPLFRWHGTDVYPMFGAAPDDDSDSGQTDSEPPAEDDDDEPGEGDDKSGEDTVSREDFEKLQKRLSAADKAREQAQKELKKREDAKKDELTKATERVAELEETTAKQAKEIAEMRLQNAFLTADTGITWHDPADALDVAERRGYLAEVVGEDGEVNVNKLRDKLKQLAKAKPHLVKTGSDDTDDKGKGNSGRTGGSVGSKGRDKKDKEPDLSRYNHLLNR